MESNIYKDPPPFQDQKDQKPTGNSFFDSLQKKQDEISVFIDPFIQLEHILSSGIVLAAIGCTVVVVKLNMSLAWLFPVLSSLSFAYHSTVKRIKYKALHQAKKQLALQQLDHDKETVEWLNSFLGRFWKNYEPSLSLSIKESIDLTLDYYRPAGVDELRLTVFTLGSEGPRIDAIKTFPNTEEEVFMMDLDLSFVPVEADSLSKEDKRLQLVRNVEIELLAKVGLLPFQVRVSEFYLSGKMRVHMKFMNEYPHIKVVDVGFVSVPEIDFIMKPLGAMDISKIGGLGDFIKETVQAQVSALMVNPLKMSFPIGEWMGADFGATELPIGVLRVSIYEAKNLRNVDVTGISDPLAIIRIGGLEMARTRIIDNTLDPKWNEIHHIIIFKSTLTQLTSKSDQLKIEIMHSNNLSDKSLGTTPALSLHDWINLIGIGEPGVEQEPMSVEKKEALIHEWGSPLDNNVSTWKKLALQNKAAGSVRIDMAYFPVVSAPPSDQDFKIARKDAAGIVTFIVHQAKDLGVGDNGQVDCIVYNDGKAVFKTPIRKRTNSPTWEYKHVMYCEDIFKDEFKFIVRHKMDPLGECTINVNQALRSTEDWYKLFGRGGKIRISTKFTPIDTKISKHNFSKELRMEPLGVLRVNLMSATKLANTELLGKSDPYCKVFLQHRPVGVSSVQKGSLNPNWNETFFCTVYSMKDMLTFEVCDSNELSKDKPLGKIHLPLGPMFARLSGDGSVADQNQLGTYELDGLTIEPTGEHTLKVTAPLYIKEDEVHKDQDEKDNPKPLETRKTSFFKKGMSSFNADLKAKKVKQKGHIVFELDLFNVLQDLKIDPVDMEEYFDQEEAKLAVTPKEEGKDVKTEEVKKDVVQLYSEEEIKKIISSNRAGLLRIKITSGEFTRKVRPYVSVLLNEDVIHSTIAPVDRKILSHWYSARDYFISDITSAKFKMIIRDQLEDEPSAKDPYLGFWIGDLNKDLLGKINNWIPFKQYSSTPRDFDSLPQTCLLNVGFGYSPVKLDYDISGVENEGVLHLDIISASNLMAADSNGFSDPFCVVFVNGVEQFKTKIIKKTLNPEFNESVDLQIRSRLRSTLLVELFDHDNFGKNDPLGKVTIKLATLKSDVVSILELPVEGGTGTVKLRYLFEPKEVKPAAKPSNEDLFATETSSLGKFGRGLSSQITGLGKLVGKRKSVSASNPEIIVESPSPEKEEPKKELPFKRPELKKSESTMSVSENSEVKKPALRKSESNFSIIDATDSIHSATRNSVNSISSEASVAVGENKTQEIQIKIIRAEGLLAKDAGGTSDPYVKVYLGEGKKGSIHKTNVCKKTLNPSWNDEGFSVSTNAPSLTFKIYDKNIVNADVFLGMVVLDVASLIKESGSFDQYFPVQDGTGKLQISGHVIEGVKKIKSKKSLLAM